MEAELAMTYTNLAAALDTAGGWERALDVYARSERLYEDLVFRVGRAHLANDLARCYTNQGMLLNQHGGNVAGLLKHDRAMVILRRLVEKEGRRELRNDLAAVCKNKADGLLTHAAEAIDQRVRQGDWEAAAALYQEAVQIRHRLVHEEQHHELAGDLAVAQLSWAHAASLLGWGQDASKAAREAVDALRSEFARTGRVHLKHVLGWAEAKLGGMLHETP